jgi:TRAP transporter 4TM/12TM fusion protein
MPPRSTRDGRHIMTKTETQPAAPDSAGFVHDPRMQPGDPEHGLPSSFGEGLAGRALFWIAVAFSAFQVVTAFGIPLDKPVLSAFPSLTMIALIRAAFVAWLGWIILMRVRGRAVTDMVLAFAMLVAAFELVALFTGTLPNQVLRTLHVGFLCLVSCGLLANDAGVGRLNRIGLWLMGLIGFGVGLYHWAFYKDLVNRAGELTDADMAVGIVALTTLFILVWRAMGIALPLVAGTFLAYCLFGNSLPAPFDHRGYSLEQVIEQMAFGTEGIYATPTAVSATFIFLFILFGSFMERAGVIQFFNDISMALFGGKQGGPGKVCVASSALMGTVSGSGVANVVASGQFTIPLMKRSGFTGAFAGGVEATSSMGGQIMPPVMGAVAFIMAETIDVPYSAIVQAAIIPALLYFGACYWAVHLEAGKLGLKGLPKSELPSARAELKRNWYLIAPLAVLVYLLFAGFTPLFAGAVGLALTVALILALAVAQGLNQTGLRVAFWLAFGLISAASMTYSIAAVLGVVLLLAIWNMFRGASGRQVLDDCVESLADGARQALPVGLACALVGIVIGTMTLTGIGSIFGNWLIGVGKESMFLALLLTMVFSLILGMGIPTIPNYIITSSLAAPILLKLDVPLIVSHMFVFYFGIMADLTPPVALAAFAAAPMAKVSGMKIGVQAVKIALPGFVVPFLAVYDPALMLQPVKGLDGAGYWVAVAYISLKACFAVGLWGAAFVGYLSQRTTLVERALMALAAGLLVAAVPLTDELGFALGAAIVGWHYWRTRARLLPS